MNIPTAFEIGKTASITKKITLQDVESFATVSGDDQPVHTSPEYALNTRFGGQIAHGTILVGLVSAVLGNVMAGPDYTVIFLEQSCIICQVLSGELSSTINRSALKLSSSIDFRKSAMFSDSL